MGLTGRAYGNGEAAVDDNQQHELYEAEREVGWATYGATENLEDLRDVWLFVNKVMNKASFKKRYPQTHRLAQPKNTKPVAFPKSIMLPGGGYRTRGSDYSHLGGVAGGKKVPGEIRQGRRSPDYAYLTWSFQGTPRVKADECFEPVGIEIFPAAIRGASANRRSINVSKWGRQKWVLMHELAHVVDMNENGAHREWHQGHGWQFSAIYLNLVGMVFGADCKKELRDQFKSGAVKYLQPRGAKNAHPWDPNPDRLWTV